MLVGNVGKLFGNIAAFPDARPDDGLLEIGIVTAKGRWQWSRTLARTGVRQRAGVAVRRDGSRPEVRCSLLEAGPLRARRRRPQEDAPAADQGSTRSGDGLRARGDEVSTATPVPETWELTGDDARRVLRSGGRRRILRDAFVRLRVADGFSHARSLAYATALVFVQAIIALIGLAVALGNAELQPGRRALAARPRCPGPGGTLLTQAVAQAHRAGLSHRYSGLIFGLVGTSDHGQHAVRPTRTRAQSHLRRRAGSARRCRSTGARSRSPLPSGTLGVGAFALLAFGQSIGDSIDNAAAEPRLAGGAVAGRRCVLATLAITMLFRWCPRRRQPCAVVAGVRRGRRGGRVGSLVTVGLSVFFSMSKSFGQIYGPLAGIVALLLWSLLSAVAVLFGGAVAAQLEAVRAGARKPQDAEKVEHSEPDQRTAPRTPREVAS